jgi:DNA-binding phage protein
LERLRDPEVAAHYLNATMENSPDHFLQAVKNVVQARHVSGASEELSKYAQEQRQPGFGALFSILRELGLHLEIAVDTVVPPLPGSASGVPLGENALPR